MQSERLVPELHRGKSCRLLHSSASLSLSLVLALAHSCCHEGQNWELPAQKRRTLLEELGSGLAGVSAERTGLSALHTYPDITYSLVCALPPSSYPPLLVFPLGAHIKASQRLEGEASLLPFLRFLVFKNCNAKQD